MTWGEDTAGRGERCLTNRPRGRRAKRRTWAIFTGGADGRLRGTTVSLGAGGRRLGTAGGRGAAAVGVRALGGGGGM